MFQCASVIAINSYVTDGASEKHDDDVIDVVAVTCLKQPH